MLIHRISFVLLSVGSSEFCSRDAVSENFIRIGFSGESAKCCFRGLPLCQENKSRSKAHLTPASKESFQTNSCVWPSDSVTSDCGCTVLDPKNLLSILASHISLNRQLKSSPHPLLLQLCSFNQPQLHIFLQNPDTHTDHLIFLSMTEDKPLQSEDLSLL